MAIDNNSFSVSEADIKREKPPHLLGRLSCHQVPSNSIDLDNPLLAILPILVDR